MTPDTSGAVQGSPISIRGITFLPDVPLETAGYGFLGAVITCDDCHEQFGPVRSIAEADFRIAAHLRRSHGFDDVRSALCAAPLCARAAKTLGLCAGHYSRLRDHGDIRADVPLQPNGTHAPRETVPCSVPDCERPHYARSYCHVHYDRLRKHGDVLAHVPIRGAK